MGSMIELSAADGHQLHAYRAGPADALKSLVVIQEIFGVNNHMRHVCDAFAAEGYAVIAPALFDRISPGLELGYSADDVTRGRNLRSRIEEAAVMLDVEAAATALGDARGIVGYCWGGTVAWFGSTRSSNFKAAVAWYGGGIAATRTEPTHCPVQMHFGEQDSGIPMADVEQIRTAQPNAEIFVYPGAQHGFGCEERSSYNPVVAQLAQERTLTFLAAHL